MNANHKQLYRYPDEGMISGVSAGLGRHFDIDYSVVRAVFVGLTVFSGFGLVAYLAFWALLDAAPPDEPEEPVDVVATTDISQNPVIITEQGSDSS
ncbi:MAG: PspC domain-containing protein [Actinomycetia bacterium]|nr:PspC domain-containing protein [Actinomycetes bacterium]MCP4223155.1 PspC domain-containing protein [Actinomycetes bacterium]MCP5034660.1 PspC domain-containing protein [Actinomycetes bacterium]